MLELLCRAINPNLSLAQAMQRWQHIRRALAEPRRRRRLQATVLRDLLS
jgi:hypothetical protein